MWARNKDQRVNGRKLVDPKKLGRNHYTSKVLIILSDKCHNKTVLNKT